MKFEKYANTEDFAADVLEILLENEAQNNLPVGFITDKTSDKSNWLFASVKDTDGAVVLTAACTPPHNIVLYETGNRPDEEAVKLLASELKGMGFALPGVLAEQGLAHRFAEAYAGSNGFYRHHTMNAMRLDRLDNVREAPGFCRPLREDDLFFAPYWERSFNEDCHMETSDIPAYIESLKKRLGRDVHYIWEDGHPVSQAIHGRSTQNGAVISSVYTPPHYRGKGYATSVVARLSMMLLTRGNKFCCLYADAANPISNSIYRKIGYYYVAVADELRFG